MTNEDKFKSLTSEELVRFFRQTGGCPPQWTFTSCPVLGIVDKLSDVELNDCCEKCWLDWLKKEEKEDEQ